jgi:tight adherence protein C
MSVGLIVFLFGVAAFLAVYAIKAPVHELAYDEYAEFLTVPGEDRPAGLFDKVVRPALRNFLPQAPMSARIKARGNSKVTELLVRSGNPWNITPEEFAGVKMLGAVGGFFAGLVLSVTEFLPGPPLASMALGAGIGFFMPKVLLDKEYGKRRKSAQRGLPESLDLLRITLNSGMNFQPALTEVCQRLPEGVVQVELARLNDDLRSGRTLERAMTDFARRAPSEEVESFCKAVIQAERLGADVSETLAAQSVSARQAYEASLDARIGKLPTTLFFPILALMVPALFIVILAPAFADINKAF